MNFAKYFLPILVFFGLGDTTIQNTGPSGSDGGCGAACNPGPGGQPMPTPDPTDPPCAGGPCPQEPK